MNYKLKELGSFAQLPRVATHHILPYLAETLDHLGRKNLKRKFKT